MMGLLRRQVYGFIRALRCIQQAGPLGGAASLGDESMTMATCESGVEQFLQVRRSHSNA